MDYEVNASMVEDGIVSADFWKVMNGLYKKEYTGMTWEEILKNYGDAEYNDWLTRNGESLDTKEKQILDAVEKASKVLLDPDADEDDKREARKELQKDLDKILGKEKREESTLQDELEDLAKTKLGDHGEIAMDLEDLADDLDKDPSKMSDKEFDKVMSDIDKAMDEIIENADEVGDDFGKSGEDVVNDANKARKEMKDAMQRMKEGGLSKEEKSDLMDKMKDALEDVISNDVEKEKSKKKREERDAAKEADRLEKFKKSHPIRKIIIILKNLADLKEIDLISEKTYNTLNRCIDELEPLTEKKFSDIKKSNLRGISDALDQLKEDLLPDLVELINNETILTKTEDDMKKFLDDIFEKVFDAFRRIFDPALDDEQKGALMKLAAQRLRAIGKMLKTQKKWRVGDDFKEAYKAEIKRLMEIQKTGGDEALMKELLDLGVINPLSLDEHGEEVYKAVTGKSSKFDDLFDMIGRMCDDKKDEISDEEVVDGLVDTLETEGASEDDLEKAREALTKLFKGEL
jgi:truncated hemoglobin YjbI